MRARTVVSAAFAGAFAAVAAVAFGQTLARFAAAPVWFAPALAGLVYGPLLTLVPDGGGGGIPQVRAALAAGEPIRGRAAVVKAVASGLTLGAGGSAGTEGPIVCFAAALGSAVARGVAVPLRPLVAAAAAGGIAGSFEAPLTGVVLVVEVLLEGTTGLEIAAVAMGSVGGTLMARALPGAPVRLPVVAGGHVGVVVAGLVAGLAGVVLARSLGWARLTAEERWPIGRLGGAVLAQGVRRVCPVVGEIFERRLAVVPARCRRFFARRWPTWARPAVGGMLAGPILLAVPPLGGTGPNLFAGTAAGTTTTLLLLAAGKIVATSVTLAAGGVGGALGPTLIVGTAVGTAVGAPVAGLAACLAAAGRAPATAVVLAVELSGIGLLPSILPAAALGWLTGLLLTRDTVFGARARLAGG